MEHTMRSLLTAFAIVAAPLFAVALPNADGISGDVLRVDHQKQCLWLDWHNDTEKIVCWNAQTKFSVLETGKAAKATEVRKGSHVRMEGDDKEDTYWATQIVIWEAMSKPPGR
jgi:hypothetical protein